MPKFNIDKIISHISKNPLLEPNRYEVIIVGPNVINQEMTMNCHRCHIPGHSIGSFDHSIIGPKRKIPNEELYEELSTSFYVSRNMNEITTINNWIQMVGGYVFYRMEYYHDIVGEMQINIYDPTEKEVANVKFHECYPVGISEFELSYVGQVPADVTVNWAYHTFQIEQDYGFTD